MMDPTIKFSHIKFDNEVENIRLGLTEDDKKFITLFQKYSHKLMIVVLKNKFVAMMYTYFYKTQMQNVMRDEPTFQKHSPIYTQIC